MGFSEPSGAHSMMDGRLVRYHGAFPQRSPCSARSPILGPEEGQENPLCSGQTVQSLVAMAATAISSSSETGQQLSWAWAQASRSREQRSLLYVGGLSQ